jgi:hypothetical protein
MHGHGAYRVLELLLEEALEERRGQRDLYYDDRQHDPGAEIEQEVKLMYARGDITAQTYHRLLEMAQSGQLAWNDLARFRTEGGAEVPPIPNAPQRERDPDVVRSLNRLYSHRNRLEEARAETSQVLQRLEADVTRLREQARVADEKAQLALPDEEKARVFLETKQETLDRVATLEERIVSLRESQQRIDTLRDELATREAELKALESGEQLAELEASIREDLLED